MLEKLKGELIVSCQALADEPLHSSFVMARMALAAKVGGASGIRASSVKDIEAIKAEVDLPLIGLIKRNYPDSEVYITATEREVSELLETRAEIIALDATDRLRPGGIETSRLVEQIHRAGRLAMADISNVAEGLAAARMGFDLIGTTLSGYTTSSKVSTEPDFELVAALSDQVNVPIICEGRIHTPEQVTEAYRCGAFSVVVGGAITRPQEITKRFTAALPNQKNPAGEVK
ncbi:N-acetylmannosamine-6-phosphate 2-epimerase [Listeria floridensis FSL S10-1187]|uniref:Putative N-acetylmannosamine-6-phosphate 2-epimerase n=1 Tax=Listeria floridensis FSL S10-1187 TaxID=1265817 RepID=A0ABN0RDW5_9LIST|nr:N-acetylmannosamine-6-phosphate 2-epimerase [Listeria floridensis]EUJ30547.1 N-acetylmannosamine-6-phosphate 2-epimerase [Listeria floridensis FSL S10-1187]